MESLNRCSPSPRISPVGVLLADYVGVVRKKVLSSVFYCSESGILETLEGNQTREPVNVVAQVLHFL